MPVRARSEVVDQEKEKERERLEEHWSNVASHGMLDQTLVKLDSQGEATLEPGSMKEKVGKFLSNWKFEAFIIALILLDLVLTLLECGLDYRVFCITPELVGVGRDRIRYLEDQPEVFLYGLDSRLNRSGYSENSMAKGDWHQEIKGSVMLQVSSVAQIANIAEDSLHVNATASILKRHAVHLLHEQPEHGEMPVEIQPGEFQSDEDYNEDYIHDGKGPSNDAEHSASAEEAADSHAAAGHETPEHNRHMGHSTLLCEGPHGERLHALEHLCHQASLAILVIFLAELIAKAWVNPEHFFQSKAHLVDLCVVFFSIVIDVVMPLIRPAREGELKADVMKVPLLLMRLWRIVRIMHGTGEMVHSGLQHVRELQERVREKEKENETLRAALKDAGVDSKSFEC